MRAPATRYSAIAAMAVIIANMIGTGVFTSLGFQLAELPAGFPILALWALGGVAAFCGAMSYAEIASALPRSGGEYSMLREIYHPAAGFVSGWISSTIGFAAPTALAAMTFAAYATAVAAPEAPVSVEKALAIVLIVLLTVVHASRRAASGGMQTALTAFKVAVILAFCLGGVALLEAPDWAALAPTAGDGSRIASPSFAVALIYVSYAYAGWNAAAYIVGEMRDPARTLPFVLAVGAGVVTALYVALNAVFLLAAPAEAYVGRVDVGFVAAERIFGATFANLVGLAMASLLVSTVSAMTIAGPRVLGAIGEDFPLFRALARLNQDGIPSRAVIAQSLLAIILILTSGFETVLVFAAFLTALNSFFAVLGLFVLRARRPGLARPFRTPLYPLTPLVYLAVTGFALGYVAWTRPDEAFLAAILLAAGLLLYALTPKPPARRG
jgi:APA family basic amino acid/polyamine antiporter